MYDVWRGGVRRLNEAFLQAQVLLAAALRTRGVESCSVNPGAVDSDIWRYWSRPVRGALRVVARAIFLTPEQAAMVCIAPILSAEPEKDLYLSPYWVPNFLPFLDLAGPFVGARPTLSKPEYVGVDQMGADAERLWQWGEALLNAAQVS